MNIILERTEQFLGECLFWRGKQGKAELENDLGSYLDNQKTLEIYIYIYRRYSVR